MIVPVILSGGGGTRLWPLSRTHFPKQYWALAGENTLLQESVLRVVRQENQDPISFSQPMIICNEEHRFLVAEQLRQINIKPSHIVLEPSAKNTAFAITIACLLQQDLDSIMLVLPSDHLIQDKTVFLSAVASAVESASDGNIVTFGVHPTRPETRYGYIKRGSAILNADIAGTSEQNNLKNPLFTVDCFVEKPDLETAKNFLQDKQYYWNSGIFLFKTQVMLDEIKRFQPKILEECRSSLSSSKKDLDFLRLGKDLKSTPVIIDDLNLSIDHAVMEHTSRAAVIPIDMGWSDVGTWDALWEVSEKDTCGNVIIGDVVTQNVRNSYLRSDNQLLSTLGLDNIIVVVTNDAILVAHQDCVQQVKEVVYQLKINNRKELDTHTRVYRPWGYYQTIDAGDRFQVKRLMINPGGKTSVQIHYHRSEHWVVVEGTALVTRGEETHLVHENESIYLPMGVKHRVENPGKIPLHFIEVQSGSYLGEDDIVRVEDAYGRVEDEKVV